MTLLSDPPVETPIGAVVRDAVAAARDAARDHLLGLQDAAGWWKGELETNVTMDAEDLLLWHILGIRTDPQTERAAVWIRSQQRSDGSWALYFGGPGDLSTTIEAYVALRLAGDQPEAAHMLAAASFARAQGGVESSRVFTRIWLAMVGQWPWDDVPTLPPEMIFAPSWLPLSVYDYGCWARQTIVPLCIVSALRPVHPLPFGVAELRTGSPRPTSKPRLSWARGFDVLDRALRTYGKRPVRRLREAAMAACAEWIVARQEADGSWGGIQPPWVYSLIALRTLGYPLDHPVVAAGIAGLDGFTIDDERGRRLEACQSPVWDTALAMIALSDAGLPPDHTALLRGARWLVAEEIHERGDWAVQRPHLEPGGWAFEFAPDIDDTAEIVLALRRVDAGRVSGLAGALRRGVTWSTGMQSADGGWGAFDADNTRELAYAIPFADFGAMIDPPSADVTAHVVEMLAAEGRGATPAARRGIAWLLAAQEDDGSWFGRWGANHVYGTGAVIPALVAAGIGGEHPAVARGVAWLHSVQNDDGGWGEDLRSYRDPAWRGRGVSTASQTAWALLALLAAGELGEPSERGIGWLAQTQRPDGSWDEPQFTGTGFPGDFYLNYHLYRLVFPLSALGRYVQLVTERRRGRADQPVVCTGRMAP